MSDEAKQPKSHLFRLILLMLCGALISWPFSIGPGDRFDFWHYAAPYAQAIVGAMVGLFIELWLRLVELTFSLIRLPGSNKDEEGWLE